MCKPKRVLLIQTAQQAPLSRGISIHTPLVLFHCRLRTSHICPLILPFSSPVCPATDASLQSSNILRCPHPRKSCLRLYTSQSHGSCSSILFSHFSLSCFLGLFIPWAIFKHVFTLWLNYFLENYQGLTSGWHIHLFFFWSSEESQKLASFASLWKSHFQSKFYLNCRLTKFYFIIIGLCMWVVYVGVCIFQ